MLEVSRVGVTESDDEIELSLELSIGGRYKKLEKSLEEEEENSGKEISGKKKGIILPRSGLSFPATATAIVGDRVERGSGSGSEVVVVEEDYYSQRNKREIQALRRQEARKKREEKLRKSASNYNYNSVNVVVGLANADDKMLLETQQLQSRARDREMRENDALVEDKEHNFAKCVGNEKNGSSSSSIIKDSNFIFTSRNNGGASDGSQDHQGSGTKSPVAAVSFLQNKVPYYPQYLQCGSGTHRNHHMVGKDENGGTKGKNVISQPLNFRPYPNGNGNLKREYGTGTGGGDSEQNSGKCGSQIPKVISSNGSPERTSSAVSDYRSTSGKGGSSSESGSHSSSIGANEQQIGVSPIQIIASEKRDLGQQQEEEDGGVGRRRRNEADVVKSSSERPKPCLPPRMPCVSTTGNGPNGKTVMGFLYTYTNTEVSIVCVCHGTSFSPAQFVEHAGGATHVTNPLRHITMVPFPFAD